MPCNDAPADNSGVLKRFLAQELPESGDVEADEAASALPDNAVLEEAAFVLACVVAGDAMRLAIFETLLGPESNRRLRVENREFYSRF